MEKARKAAVNVLACVILGGSYHFAIVVWRPKESPSRKIRVGDKSVRRYYRADFEEIWRPYLSRCFPSVRERRHKRNKLFV
jgi:hypothetical protein